MSRLDAISLAILIELGLTSSDAGWRLADAADSGPQVVRVAKKYKGATYKWSGASLRGSDCSGFTWYVCKKVTGKNITRGAKEQSKHGRSVSRDKWRPG